VWGGFRAEHRFSKQELRLGKETPKQRPKVSSAQGGKKEAGRELQQTYQSKH